MVNHTSLTREETDMLAEMLLRVIPKDKKQDLVKRLILAKAGFTVQIDAELLSRLKIPTE